MVAWVDEVEVEVGFYTAMMMMMDLVTSAAIIS